MDGIKSFKAALNMTASVLGYIVGLIWVCSIVVFPFLGTGLGFEHYGVAGAIIGCGLGLAASFASTIMSYELVKKNGG